MAVDIMECKENDNSGGEKKCRLVFIQPRRCSVDQLEPHSTQISTPCVVPCGCTVDQLEPYLTQIRPPCVAPCTRVGRGIFMGKDMIIVIHMLSKLIASAMYSRYWCRHRHTCIIIYANKIPQISCYLNTPQHRPTSC